MGEDSLEPLMHQKPLEHFLVGTIVGEEHQYPALQGRHSESFLSPVRLPNEPRMIYFD